MKPHKDHILLVLALIFLIGALLLMTSCNATKQVLKSPTATEKVAMEYIKMHPPRNDTQYIPGKVIKSDTTIYDTIPLPFPVKEKYTEHHYKETLVRDTIKIIDRSFAEGLLKRVEALEANELSLKDEIREWKKEAYIHRGIWIAIALGFLAWVGMKFLRPLIKAYLKI